jgi:CRISPR-associated protein Csm4
MSSEMNEWRLVRLDFGRIQAHFGELGIGLEETSERVRSDTLFSAWISAYARLYGDRVEALLQQFPIFSQGQSSTTEAPFSLSSTFVYHDKQENGKTKTTYYVPRPYQFPPNYPIEDDLEFTKTYKNLRFLPLEVWKRWYQGTGFSTAEDLPELIAETRKEASPFTSLKDAGTFAYKEAFKFYKVPKIAVDRTTRATNLYYTGFVQFQWGTNPSGLYFLLRFNPTLESQQREELEQALYFLGEEGIGGERSSGAGRFTATWNPLPQEWEAAIYYRPDGESHQRYSLLSLFWDDTVTPEFLDESSYELHQRSGWIASPSGRQRRRQVVPMFTEGSVFKPDQLTGKLVDVTPPGFEQQPNGHRIYRSGIALSLPIRVLDIA